MRRTLAAVSVLALLSGCRQNETRAEEPPPIEIKATVHPAQSATITAPIDGKVRTLDVHEGSVIAVNGRILELTNAVVERDAAVCRAQLAWIDTRLKRGRSPLRVAPHSSDNLGITARILEVKRQRLEKMKKLRRTNDITAREFEQVEVEYLAALRDYNDQRRAAIGAPVAGGDDMALLRIEHDKTAAEEKFATQRQEMLQVTSPIAGTVTRLSVAQGQAVFPRDPIAEVSDVATLRVTGSIAPELLRYIHVGMPVQVKIFSVPPRTFADEIDSVIPMQGAGGDSRSAAVVVSIPNPDRAVQPNTDAVISLRPR